MNTCETNICAPIPLWNQTAPFTTPGDADLTEHFRPSDDGIERLTDVTSPTLTYYPASGRGPHPAVMICPGGGYGILAWNHEGKDVAGWLNANGISAFLLKYRCPNRRQAALADAVRGMRLIRSRADKFNLRADKIGILGFSAGAHLSARVCTLPEEPAYPPQDATDNTPARPDFAFIIYPAYIDREGWKADPDLNITPETPPTFLIQSQDDTLVNSSLAYYIALKDAGVPTELHLYPSGGHGYGLMRTGRPTDAWPALAIDWFGREVMRSRAW